MDDMAFSGDSKCMQLASFFLQKFEVFLTPSADLSGLSGKFE